MFKKTILVIDDTELMQMLIKDTLENEGYSVVTASNGMDGINKVREEKPDLVLLDIVMPIMDGFEVCKILRDDESNNLTPIIMLTAQDDEEDKLKGLELGADDYILKPFNRRELISRVRNTLRRIDRNRRANPLTGLPGNIEIQSELDSRIAKGEKFAVLYADLDNFKAYNDVYGFSSGDIAIKLTADVITNNVKAFSTNHEDFVGHVGGDDFVMITVPERVNNICEGIIEDFDKKILELYTKEDRDNGFIITTNRLGQRMSFPIISISLAVVTNEHRVFASHVEVAEIAAEVKKKAKMIPGSVYIKDRRKLL